MHLYRNGKILTIARTFNAIAFDWRKCRLTANASCSLSCKNVYRGCQLDRRMCADAIPSSAAWLVQSSCHRQATLFVRKTGWRHNGEPIFKLKITRDSRWWKFEMVALVIFFLKFVTTWHYELPDETRFTCFLLFLTCRFVFFSHSLLPCRSFCNKIRSACLSVHHSASFVWPKFLDCSNFPRPSIETDCYEPRSSKKGGWSG